MSNRLNATDRIDIVSGVDGPAPLDRSEIIRQAEQLRAETLAHGFGVMWRGARAALRRLFRSPAKRDVAADLSELDDRTLADIGITRYQVPGFVAREIRAARDVASRTRKFRTPASAA